MKILVSLSRSMKALIVGGLAMVGLLAGCATTAPQSPTERAALTASCQGTLASFKARDPSLAPLLKKAVGWAIFPEIGKGAFGLGGSYGKGEVYEYGRLIGYADVSELSLGVQVGAKSFSQILLFLRPEDLDKFKRGDWTVAGNASAVALSAGVAGTTDPSKGVIALVDTQGGLMAEAAVGGQRYRFSPVGASSRPGESRRREPYEPSR
jgi:lipid-binding SYLF domain-containing protein